jgi:hypothetical protein
LRIYKRLTFLTVAYPRDTKTLFWLLNILDKVIGGAHFLFVGKDRFAQIERFFDSIGLGAPIFANVALVITAGLKTFAFVFFTGA